VKFASRQQPDRIRLSGHRRQHLYSFSPRAAIFTEDAGGSGNGKVLFQPEGELQLKVKVISVVMVMLLA
jgi:hypothetical protein